MNNLLWPALLTSLDQTLRRPFADRQSFGLPCLAGLIVVWLSQRYSLNAEFLLVYVVIFLFSSLQELSPFVRIVAQNRNQTRTMPSAIFFRRRKHNGIDVCTSFLGYVGQTPSTHCSLQCLPLTLPFDRSLYNSLFLDATNYRELSFFSRSLDCQERNVSVSAFFEGS